MLLSSGLFSQNPEFDQLLSLFEEDRKEIPAELAEKYFDFHATELYANLVTNGIIIKSPFFIALSTHVNCGAGGICENSNLTTFDSDGNQIDAISFEKALGDCTFLKRRSLELKTDTLLVFENSNMKNNCETDRIVSLEIWNEYIFIKSDGTFGDPIIKQINERRQYYMVSSQLLTEEELKEYSKEELAIMRNEVFAAYGYQFKSKKWRQYFESKSWYKGVSKTPENNLSILERMNLQLIKSLETK